MFKLLLCTVMLIGLQAARAEDAPAAPDTTTASEAKSFFEIRTLEDVQEMVKIDPYFTDGSIDLSSNGKAGPG
jgi:hypothetical protein